MEGVGVDTRKIIYLFIDGLQPSQPRRVTWGLRRVRICRSIAATITGTQSQELGRQDCSFWVGWLWPSADVGSTGGAGLVHCLSHVIVHFLTAHFLLQESIKIPVYISTININIIYKIIYVLYKILSPTSSVSEFDCACIAQAYNEIGLPIFLTAIFFYKLWKWGKDKGRHLIFNNTKT